MKRITFIIPMYNVAPYIERCVLSIENQNLADDEYEILLIDDNSTDETISIVHRLQQKNKSIKILKGEKKLGAGGARNLGMRYAEGDYLWFIDADDYIFANVTKSLLELAEKNFLNLLTFDIESVKVGERENIESHFNSQLDLKCLDNGPSLYGKMSLRIEPFAYIIENTFIKKLQLQFDEHRFAEDIKFSHSLMMHATRAGNYQSKPYVYVHRLGSVERNNNPSHVTKTVKDKIYAVEGLKKMLDSSISKNISQETLDKMNKYIDYHLFFALLRVGKSNFSFSEICRMYADLKNSKLLPIRLFPGSDYPQFRWRILRIFVNTPWLFIPLSFVVSLVFKFLNRK